MATKPGGDMDIQLEDARAWLDGLGEVLTSAPAWRAYAVVLGALVLLGSLALAIRANGTIAAQFEETARALRQARKGQPKSAEAWERRRQKIRQIARRGVGRAARWSLLSLACGVALPAGALFVATIFYEWFDATGSHLLNAVRTPLTEVDPQTAAIFVLDQTLRGGLFDLLEVFEWRVTPVDNNPTRLPFSVGLFLYHLYVEAFVFSGTALFAQSVWRLHRQAAAEIEQTPTAEDLDVQALSTH